MGIGAGGIVSRQGLIRHGPGSLFSCRRAVLLGGWRVVRHAIFLLSLHQGQNTGRKKSEGAAAQIYDKIVGLPSNPKIKGSLSAALQSPN